MSEELDLAALPALLRSTGDAGSFKAVRLAGGTNNRVFRIDTATSRYCYKVYQSAPGQPRDRLASEIAFLAFAAEHGVQRLPRVLAFDRSSHAALFEFIEGRRPGIDDIDQELVEEAAQFCWELDRCRSAAGAELLPPASDSCFSLREHIDSVERRLVRLQLLPQTPDTRGEARSFVEHVISPACRRVIRAVEHFARSEGVALERRLTKHEQCLSASDFGFHNALMGDGRHITFIDFEYAGWDDPAKMVADFFSQADRPVPMQHFDRFIEIFASDRRDRREMRARGRALVPLHRAKWGMIVLNDLVRFGDGGAFATEADEAHFAERLAKARQLFASLPA